MFEGRGGGGGGETEREGRRERGGRKMDRERQMRAEIYKGGIDEQGEEKRKLREKNTDVR